MKYLIIYALVMCVLVFHRERGQCISSEKFLVAERRVGGVIGAMSIAASWIWAPAIFISTRVGYEWGYSGLVWFILPNMLALIIFAPLASRIRRQLADGYSYIEAMRKKGGGFATVQLIVQLSMQVLIFAIQLTAGAELLSLVTGSSYSALAIGMAVTPLLYASFAGLRTSVFTDAVQYAVIAISAAALFIVFPAEVAEFDSRSFNPVDPQLLLSFGLSSGLGLVVAIFADHQQWQRSFAAREGKLISTFWGAALLHGFVTFCLGSLGCMIAQQSFAPPAKLELVGIAFVSQFYNPLFAIIFVVMALCALISTLDSSLCAFSSLMMREIGRKSDDVRVGRFWMLLLAIFGAAVALYRPSLLTLWFLAGTIRLCSFVPTVCSIMLSRFEGWWGTYAIVIAIPLGASVFGYGVWSENQEIRTWGMLTSMVSSLLVIVCCKLASFRGNGLALTRRIGSATA